ncbi:ASCH domain-containing protein [Sporomusa malonica]|uniref:ASCH domain-containing protein n=1 Tax=Sporomusa malonica TaxID=112901 RepID=A0A1W2CA73_9FIRM|nr:ASCH domain-containing protein [Sporomusa malonica]SMC82155.1 ASCH domain-containing protein [Sporomusa malonica]
MRAITILQPWAELIVRRFKTIETRSWPTKYRGQLAIHAGASLPAYAKACIPEINQGNAADLGVGAFSK